MAKYVEKIFKVNNAALKIKKQAKYFIQSKKMYLRRYATDCLFGYI